VASVRSPGCGVTASTKPEGEMISQPGGVLARRSRRRSVRIIQTSFGMVHLHPRPRLTSQVPWKHDRDGRIPAMAHAAYGVACYGAAACISLDSRSPAHAFRARHA
jgi:hypothetical protein